MILVILSLKNALQLSRAKKYLNYLALLLSENATAQKEI